MSMEPPKELTARFCPECGQGGQFHRFKVKHYAGGKLCQGTPITLTYKLQTKEVCEHCELGDEPWLSGNNFWMHTGGVCCQVREHPALSVDVCHQE